MIQKGSGPYLGVDIGGTKIAVGVVDNEGNNRAQSSISDGGERDSRGRL